MHVSIGANKPMQSNSNQKSQLMPARLAKPGDHGSSFYILATSWPPHDGDWMGLDVVDETEPVGTGILRMEDERWVLHYDEAVLQIKPRP